MQYVIHNYHLKQKKQQQQIQMRKSCKYVQEMWMDINMRHCTYEKLSNFTRNALVYYYYYYRACFNFIFSEKKLSRLSQKRIYFQS